MFNPLADPITKFVGETSTIPNVLVS